MAARARTAAAADFMLGELQLRLLILLAMYVERREFKCSLYVFVAGRPGCRLASTSVCLDAWFVLRDITLRIE